MEAEIRGLCIKAREIFLSQPMLLELEAPIKICGKTVSIQAMYTASIPTSLKSSSMEGFRLRQTICSSAITSIEVSNRSKQFACCWHTKSNTPRISSYCEAITSAPVLTAYTDSTTNVQFNSIQANEDIPLNCGRPSRIAST
jgi:hypothetical protein